MTVHMNAQGKPVVGPLSNNKEVLRKQVAMIVLRHSLSGGKITKCHPGVARGAEFSRNQHPKLGIQVPMTE